MNLKALAKLVAVGGIGVGGILYAQEAYCDTCPNENDVHFTRLRTGWIWNSNWDKRDPVYRIFSRSYSRQESKAQEQEKLELLEKVTPKAPRNIFLIRHGQYNLQGECDSDRVLTAVGRKQATATGIRLSTLTKSYNRLVVSDMSRALETAEIIGKHLSQNIANNSLSSLECDPRLREGCPIEANPPSRTWHPQLHYYDDGIRIEAAFRKYFHRAEPEQEKESYELIVCHANVIRYFCCRALQFPPERWLRMSLGNGSITHIRIYEDGKVLLMSFGDNSHMPKELLTTT